MGDSAVYDTPAFRTGDLVVSPYLDDRISCAVLLSALSESGVPQRPLPGVHRPGGGGAAGGTDRRLVHRPDYAVAVDVTDVDDTPGSERAGTPGWAGARR